MIHCDFAQLREIINLENYDFFSSLMLAIGMCRYSLRNIIFFIHLIIGYNNSLLLARSRSDARWQHIPSFLAVLRVHQRLRADRAYLTDGLLSVAQLLAARLVFIIHP